MAKIEHKFITLRFPGPARKPTYPELPRRLFLIFLLFRILLIVYGPAKNYSLTLQIHYTLQGCFKLQPPYKMAKMEHIFDTLRFPGNLVTLNRRLCLIFLFLLYVLLILFGPYSLTLQIRFDALYDLLNSNYASVRLTNVP